MSRPRLARLLSRLTLAALILFGAGTTPAKAAGDTSAIGKRQRLEEKAVSNRFAIIPYKQNYLLPFAYDTTPNKAPYVDQGLDLHRTEVKFQLSFKMPLWEQIFAGRGTLYGAYTQLSFWQAYNRTESSPFRETNYEPEIFLAFDDDIPVLGVRNRMAVFGLVHQSNGRGGELSRSWNRIYAMFAFERGNFYFAVKPWYRLPENKKTDDNPDIEKYMGHGEFYAVYTWGKQRFGLMLRNNLRARNRGAIQLDWSFPLLKKIGGYIQYFNGYGESLIDYNHATNRFGVGIIFANWL
jgi:phospholipase A1